MNTEYCIDISKNIKQESKPTRITEKIYMYGFLFIGCFYIIYTILKGKNWENLNIPIMCFFLFTIKYLQTEGLWIYKKYFSINIDVIKWQRTIFRKGNIKWNDIKNIQMEFPKINFELATQKNKTFTLYNLTAAQIETIKVMVAKISTEKGIKFTSV